MGHPKHIENAAVEGSKDSGIENVQVHGGEYAGDRGKKSGPILRTERHRGAISFREMFHAGHRALAVESLHQFKMSRHVVFRRRETITFRHRFDKMIDSLGVMIFAKSAIVLLYSQSRRKAECVINKW